VQTFETSEFSGGSAARNNLRLSLRQQFDSARYGHYFRTSTFINTATGAEEWLYAVQDPHSRRCILMKAREKESTGPERIKVKEDLPFFDALDHMNRFENLLANPGYLAVDESEKERLGETHFDLFAKREGLIRDIKTREFHPTLQGHVVTSGSFDPQDLSDAIKFAATPQKKPESFVIPGHEILTRTGETSSDAILHMYKNIETLSALIDGHENLLKISNYYNKNTIDIDARYSGKTKIDISSYELNLKLDFSDFKRHLEVFQPSQAQRETKSRHYSTRSTTRTAFAVTGARITRTLSPTAFGADSFPHYLFLLLLSDLEKIKPDSQPKDEFHDKVLGLHRLVFEHCRARNAYTAMTGSGRSVAEREQHNKKFKSQLSKVEKAGRLLGLDAVEIGTVSAYAYTKEILPHMTEISDFITGLKATKQECQNAIAAEQKRLAELVKPPEKPTEKPAP